MLRSIGATKGILALALTQLACSAGIELAADDPYANCVDLGDLAQLAGSQGDAERRLRERVLELGGDTLLFGVRGWSGRLGEVPEEIAERRKARLATPAAAAEPPAVAVTSSDDTEAPDALPALEPGTGRRRAASITVEQAPESAGQLWFYGAALRCNPSAQSL